jgi:hypothetical protein
MEIIMELNFQDLEIKLLDAILVLSIYMEQKEIKLGLNYK